MKRSWLSLAAAVLTVSVFQSGPVPAQVVPPAFLASNGSVNRYDKPGKQITPFPGWRGPMAVAESPDQKWLFVAIGWDALIIQRHAIDANGDLVLDGYQRVRYYDQANYRAVPTLTFTPVGLFVSEGPGGFGRMLTLNPQTMQKVAEVATGAAVTGSPLASAAPPPPEDSTPVTFGVGNRWIYIDFGDPLISRKDQASVTQAVAQKLLEWGVPFQVSNARPPQSAMSTLYPKFNRIDPNLYGTARIVPNSRWPWSGASGFSEIGCWTRRNQNTLSDNAIWGCSTNVGGYTYVDAMARAILHEIGHALGSLDDLYDPFNPSANPGPVGNLMSATGVLIPAGSLNSYTLLTPQQLLAIQTGYNGWMGESAPRATATAQRELGDISAMPYADFKAFVERRKPSRQLALVLAVGVSNPKAMTFATHCTLPAGSLGLASGLYACWWDGTQAVLKPLPATVPQTVPEKSRERSSVDRETPLSLAP